MEDLISPPAALLEALARQLVDSDGSVHVSAEGNTLLLTVAETDLHRLVGRNGQTRRALECIVNACSHGSEQPFSIYVRTPDVQ